MKKRFQNSSQDIAKTEFTRFVGADFDVNLWLKPLIIS
jgi:hypothetical protein